MVPRPIHGYSVSIDSSSRLRVCLHDPYQDHGLGRGQVVVFADWNLKHGDDGDRRGLLFQGKK